MEQTTHTREKLFLFLQGHQDFFNKLCLWHSFIHVCQVGIDSTHHFRKKIKCFHYGQTIVLWPQMLVIFMETKNIMIFLKLYMARQLSQPQSRASSLIGLPTIGVGCDTTSTDDKQHNGEIKHVQQLVLLFQVQWLHLEITLPRV